MDHIAKAFSSQVELLPSNVPYVDELATIKALHELPSTKQKQFHELTQNLLVRLKEDQDTRHDRQSCKNQARLLREEGNRVHKTITNQNRLLEAAQLYTKAIFKAEDAYDELCLSFANRGLALQEFGYYQEAYDDCCYSLKFGYDEKLQHKIIMRQAYCAAKLGRIEDLDRHLICLRGKELNDNYRNQLLELEQKLKDLKDEIINNEIKQEEEHPIFKRQTIITDSTRRDRYMIAKESIKNNEIVFQEEAAGFVPIDESFICHQCASIMMVAPIPCPNCCQRVVFCSRKCHQSHADIHKYECQAYRVNLLKMLGVSHLAMRLVITYFPAMVTRIQHWSGTLDIWKNLMELAKEDDNKNGLVGPQYGQSLNMINHLNNASSMELIYYALSANTLQVYLETQTDFFEQFPPSNRKDLKLIVSALIVRHAGQLVANAHVGHTLSFNQELPLLEAKLWQAPRRLKLGWLHKLNQLKLITALNLPYLSLCNHSCDPSITPKFDGIQITVYASRNIKSGEEIFNCYTQDYKNCLKQERCDHLKKIYHFECRCSKCVASDSDEAYLKHHQYKCESCDQLYVPLTNLQWWLESEMEVVTYCPHCKVKQGFPWYQEFYRHLDAVNDRSSRQMLYKTYHQLNNWLIGHHKLKLNMAGEIIKACFKTREDGFPLYVKDYTNLVKIIQQQLEGISYQKGSDCLFYIGKMTYLWDLVALGKCPMSKEEFQRMKSLLEMAPREISEIFINYYNDFIEQQQC